MHLPLTPERVAAAYDLLRLFEPFCRWHLPPSSEITFRIIRTKTKYGDYNGPPHTIRVSSATIGHIDNLLRLLGHEVIHLKLRMSGRRNWDTHGAEFRKLAHAVCRLHGYDLGHFI